MPNPFEDERFWITTGLLVFGLLAAAAFIWMFRHSRRRPDAGPSPNDELSRYRSLYEKGEISQEEFNRLRGVLGGQIRQSLGIEKPAPKPEPPAGDTAVEGPPPEAPSSS
jgi:hypothetical protein